MSEENKPNIEEVLRPYLEQMARETGVAIQDLTIEDLQAHLMLRYKDVYAPMHGFNPDQVTYEDFIQAIEEKKKNPDAFKEYYRVAADISIAKGMMKYAYLYAPMYGLDPTTVTFEDFYEIAKNGRGT